MTGTTIFEKSRPGLAQNRPPLLRTPLPVPELPAGYLRRKAPALPELTEGQVVRHYTRLSSINYSVDTGFYPLGSCTMKYNPRIGNQLAADAAFASVHPLQPAETVQGWLEMLWQTEQMLNELCGMSRFTLAPAAGAQGELCGMLIMRAYHQAKGGGRTRVLVPDSAHGTNPASAALAGFKVQQVPSNPHGRVDLEALKKALGDDVAGLMLTNPNTLGLFERDIVTICRLVHEAGGLVYYDGANFNALMGRLRPGDMGFDIVHLNLHKSFSTPHGGGGPGAGPVGVTKELEPFLPAPRIEKRADGSFGFADAPAQSIGRLSAFHGNMMVVARAYAYMRMLGAAGLRQVSDMAVLNANYLWKKLAQMFELPYCSTPMHEFVVTAPHLKKEHLGPIDVAKRLLDYGFHPPTVYFPLIVAGAIMIEPTETESKATLEAFAEAMLTILEEAREHPELLRTAPHHTPVGRLDEVGAAKNLDLRWKPTTKPS
jgi:glycine dehydrogenase subunit 2